MTRVATFGASQFLVSQMLRTQAQMFDSQTKVATGTKSTTYAGYGADNTAILSAKTVLSQRQGFLDSNKELATQLDIQNTALGAIADIADGLRQDLIQAVDLNSAVGLESKIRDKVESLIGFLNTKNGDQYIFSGTNTDQPPVNITSADDLIALANSSDAFSNNDQKLSLKVDDNRVMQYGVLASDVAGPLMDALKRILDFTSGTLPSGANAYAPAGPLNDPLTQKQQQFLISEFQNAVDAIKAARDQESLNGVKMQSLDTLINRQTEDRDFVQSFVTDMTQNDMAEAITNLKADQTQLQAAIQVVGQLNHISLLNVL